MTRKCLGCGIVLQKDDPLKIGYTPKIENDYCMRCFKIIHYNKKIEVTLPKSNKEILNKINEYNYFVLFLCDFLNIYEKVINTYKKITAPKILVITKSDLIPKNIIKEKLINNIKKIYSIDEDVILSSTNNKEELSKIANKIKTKKNILLAGYTNAGKSSLLMKLTGEVITISKKSNTTLDFFAKKYADVKVIDSPGFVPENFLDDYLPDKRINPRTYQLEEKYYLEFLGFEFSFSLDNYITIYMSNTISIEKRRKKDNTYREISIPANCDIIIKGVGFINSKIACELKTNIDENLIEIRESLVGGTKNE